MIALRCPVEPEHGAVIPLADSRWGWYCPHWSHDGWRETGPTRAFFTTAEVEAGSLNEPAPATAGIRRRWSSLTEYRP